MTTKIRLSSIILIAIFITAGLSSTAFADSEFDDVPSLQKIYGDGEDVHKPGLPDAGELRVYWFWSAESPCSRRAEPAIKSLVENFSDVEVIVVHSNVNESVERVREIAGEADLGVSIYGDNEARLAIAIDARMTPEVVVVADSGIIYKGQPARVHRRGFDSYVEDVVDKWRTGAEIERAYRRPSGCPVRRP